MPDSFEAELKPGGLQGPVDWTAVYGRPGPLVVEIGCGGGRALLNMALARPAENFLGVELCGEYYRMAHARANKRRVENVRVIVAEAQYLLACFFPDRCVQEYHIYFPDPWPKKRHHKRRLFNPPFCAQLRRTLLPGGVLYVATDDQEYYAEIEPLLREALAVEPHPGVWEEAPLGRTNFEVKYMAAGRPIYRLVARRPADCRSV